MRAINYFLALAAVALLFGASNIWAQGKSAGPVQDKPSIVDTNGDGICDLTGRQIGTGNLGNGPRNGSGFGAQSGKRLGPQDCTQPRLGQGNGSGAGGGAMGGGRRGGKR